jgi:hypothetical protein
MGASRKMKECKALVFKKKRRYESRGMRAEGSLKSSMQEEIREM